MAGVRVPVTFDGDFGQLMAGLESSLSGVATKLTGAGSALTRGLTVPLIGLGTLAASEFATFESSLTKIENLTGVTGAELETLSPKIRKIGTVAGVSGTDAANAFFFLQSGIGDSTKSLDALDAATRGSAVGLGSTEEISKALVSVMANFGDEAGNATDIMNTFGSAAQASALDADQIASGLQGVIPFAAQAGVSLDDLAATMAVISPNFSSGAEAGTALRAAMRAVVAPTKEAEKMLENAGSSSAELAEIAGKKGLSGAMQFLGKTFDGSQKDLTRMLGSAEAAAAVMGFLGADADTVAQTFENVADKSFDLDEAFAKVADDSGFRVTQSIARMRDSLIDLGGIVLPIAADALERLAGVVQTVADRFRGLPPEAQTMIAVVGGIVAAIGPALLIAGQFAGTLSALAGAGGLGAVVSSALRFLGPIGLVAGALFAAWQNSEPFRQAVFDLGQTIMNVAEQVMPQFLAVGQTLTTEVLPVLASLFATVATHVGQLLAAVLPLVGTLLEELMPVILQLVQTALPPLIELFGSVASLLGTVLPPLLSALAILFQEILIPAIEAILPIVETVFSEIGAKIEGASLILQGLIDFVTGVFSGDWQAAWDGVQLIFDGFVTGITDAADAWLDLLEEKLGISFDDQQKTVEDALTGMSEDFTTKTGEMSTTTGDVFGTIANTINHHMGNAAGFLEEQWDIMDAESDGAMSDIRNTVVSGMSAVTSNIARGWTHAVLATTQALSRFGQHVQRGMLHVVLAIGQGMGRAADLVGRGMGRVVSAVSSAMANAAKAAGRGMGDFISNVSRGIGRALGFFKNFRGNVRRAVSGLSGALYSIGLNLVSGLINGIRDAAWRAYSAARSVVLNAISAARSALGIASPSKVFEEIGRQTGQGMAIGLEGTRGLVQAAADRSLVPDISSRIGARSNAAARSTPADEFVGEGTATVVLNEYGPRTDSAKRREIEWNLRYPTRGRTFETGQLAVA